MAVLSWRGPVTGRSGPIGVDDVVIAGRVVFPADDRPADAAALVVRLEDVSLADAPATTVAQQRIEHPATDAGDVPFRIEVPEGALDPRRRYTLRAHVDVSGTGTVTAGDFVSTVATPVGPGPTVTGLEVRRI
jgi:uncharacterized lipoprotein YbaY